MHTKNKVLLHGKNFVKLTKCLVKYEHEIEFQLKIRLKFYLSKQDSDKTKTKSLVNQDSELFNSSMKRATF